MRHWNVEFIIRAEVQAPDDCCDKDMIARCGAAIINEYAPKSEQVVFMKDLLTVKAGSSCNSSHGDESLGDFKLFSPEHLKNIG